MKKTRPHNEQNNTLFGGGRHQLQRDTPSSGWNGDGVAAAAVRVLLLLAAAARDRS